MRTTPEYRTLTGKLAARHRWHPGEPDDDLRAELVTVGLIEDIRRKLDGVPLNAEQADRIRAELPAGASGR